MGFVVASELLPYICKRKIDFYEDFIQFLIEQSMLKPEVQSKEIQDYINFTQDQMVVKENKDQNAAED